MNLILASAAEIESLDYEIVERKGIGHPDTIADAIAERASRYYSLWCLETFGRVAHHWFDKVMVLGADSNTDFGVGEITAPLKVIVGGKAARAVGAVPLPIERILASAAADVLKEVLFGFDAERHLVVLDELVDHRGPSRRSSRYRPDGLDGLAELGGPGVSNDSNILSAFAPFSRLERLTLEAERFLTGQYRARFPHVGTDVKVFGRRRGLECDLYLNVPFVSSLIASRSEYDRRLDETAKAVELHLRSVVDDRRISVAMNAFDDHAYLTATGSVVDSGDIGAVGRGNRATGLITPMRPMSIEAPAGKNPIDHTGKLYTILAQRIADEVHRETRLAAQVHMFTLKGRPLDDPSEVTVSISDEHRRSTSTEAAVHRIVAKHCAHVGAISQELVVDGIELW